MSLTSNDKSVLNRALKEDYAPVEARGHAMTEEIAPCDLELRTLTVVSSYSDDPHTHEKEQAIRSSESRSLENQLIMRKVPPARSRRHRQHRPRLHW